MFRQEGESDFIGERDFTEKRQEEEREGESGLIGASDFTEAHEAGGGDAPGSPSVAGSAAPRARGRRPERSRPAGVRHAGRAPGRPRGRWTTPSCDTPGSLR